MDQPVAFEYQQLKTSSSLVKDVPSSRYPCSAGDANPCRGGTTYQVKPDHGHTYGRLKPCWFLEKSPQMFRNSCQGRAAIVQLSTLHPTISFHLAFELNAKFLQTRWQWSSLVVYPFAHQSLLPNGCYCVCPFLLSESVVNV